MDRLILFQQQRQIMLVQLKKALPEEACGILGGCGEQVESVAPVTNQLHSPTRYYMDPVELVKCLHRLDDLDQDILAIYHSHPNGPDHPSATDIDEYLYPDSAMLIWFPTETGWEVRGYMIQDRKAREIPLNWMPGP